MINVNILHEHFQAENQLHSYSVIFDVDKYPLTIYRWWHHPNAIATLQYASVLAVIMILCTEKN